MKRRNLFGGMLGALTVMACRQISSSKSAPVTLKDRFTSCGYSVKEYHKPTILVESTPVSLGYDYYMLVGDRVKSLLPDATAVIIQKEFYSEGTSPASQNGSFSLNVIVLAPDTVGPGQDLRQKIESRLGTSASRLEAFVADLNGIRHESPQGIPVPEPGVKYSLIPQARISMNTFLDAYCTPRHRLF